MAIEFESDRAGLEGVCVVVGEAEEGSGDDTLILVGLVHGLDGFLMVVDND